MKNILKVIDSFDVITLFRHEHADFDALGAQFGLKQFIIDNYPEKEVYALGDSVGSCAKYFPAIDVVEDDKIKDSCAIILDVANAQRIDDERWKSAKFKIKIDHHVFVERYADLEYVYEDMAATCQILAAIFKEARKELTPICAQYLYTGIVTDTLGFSTPSTNENTLIAAAYLLRYGVKVEEISQKLFLKTLSEFQYETYLRSNMKTYKNKIAYIIVNKQDYEMFGLNRIVAKEKVNVFKNLEEYPIWGLFVEMDSDEEVIYSGSLRSRDYKIQNVVRSYGGGGHMYACGVKNLTKESIFALLDDLFMLV